MTNSVTLPPPPSANNLWRIARNRQYRSSAYNAWLDIATDAMKRQMEPVDGPVHVAITLHEGKGVMVTADLDNFVKPILDALKPPSYDKEGVKITKPGAAIISDDSLATVQLITVAYEPWTGKKSKRPDAQVTVTVSPLSSIETAGILRGNRGDDGD